MKKNTSTLEILGESRLLPKSLQYLKKQVLAVEAAINII